MGLATIECSERKRSSRALAFSGSSDVNGICLLFTNRDLLGNGGVMLDNSFDFARNFEGSAVYRNGGKWFGVQDGMTAGVNDNALLQNTFYGNGLLTIQDGLVKMQMSSQV